MDLKAGGLGSLGAEQLDWLKRDVQPLKSSTPIGVFAHIPLWAVYPQWGWGTNDSAQALALLKKFGSVTVLNGHIHQTLQKVEGNVRFHTAFSTAFPQPAGDRGSDIDNFAFEPKALTVKAGTTVRWVNRDDVPHLIISSTGKFPNSKVLDTNQQHTATFDTPGDYPYFCSIHLTMVGKVIVK